MAAPSPDGVLLLDKPPGITSTRALAMAKRLLGAAKGGHTGTLDPFATGLLPLVFGEATKFSRFLIDANKTYEATLRLGEQTVSGDPESPVTTKRDVDVCSPQIDDVLRRFRGTQSQLPPMHSAIRVEGRRLYDYARAGQEVAREARNIHIGELVRLHRQGDDVAIRVTCSKGTYVRTLAQDIGDQLGCGAHLVALRRIAVGHLRLEDAVTLEALQHEGIDAARAELRPLEVLVASLPRVELTDVDADRFGHGQAIRGDYERSDSVAVYAPGSRFLGVGACIADDGLTPVRLLTGAAPKSPDFA